MSVTAQFLKSYAKPIQGIYQNCSLLSLTFYKIFLFVSLLQSIKFNIKMFFINFKEDKIHTCTK